MKEGLTDPDNVPEPPDEATTQPGDLWILGEHRLLCGDSGSTEDVDRLLDGQTIQLVNTDPPYNVKVEPRSSTAIAAGQSSYPDLSQKMHHQGFDVARGVIDPKTARKKMRPKDRPLENDFVSDEEFALLLRAWFGQMARVLEPGRGFYIWGGYANLGNYPPALKECGLYFSQGIVWDKEHPVLTRKDFMGAFEICFYGWREGAGHTYLGPEQRHRPLARQEGQPGRHGPPDREAGRAGRAGHSVLQPAGRERLDLFGGSGSTLIACEQTGPAGVPDGGGRAVLRRHRPAVGTVHGADRSTGGCRTGGPGRGKEQDMTFRELLRGAQKATRRAIDQVEVQSVHEDELLAWFQLKKELLVVMTSSSNWMLWMRALW